ncbi:MAG: SWIM zinc finger family protein [Erysipelotrichaceae bacterium]|nr:SWIM zinc finger family protein [Erysipelotrichaceae bacterium]
MQWQDLFSSNILDRGYDYYMSDNILEMHRKSSHLKARVKGEHDYHIEIDLDHIENMTCDCQYYQSGNYCKHLAAVLFAYDDKPIEKEDNEINMDHIIESFDKHQLQQILKDLSAKDDNLKNYLISLSQNISLDNEHQRIKNIFEQYRIIDDLPDVFTQLNNWVQLGYNRECFELVVDIYERLIKLVKQHEFFTECQNILEDILKHCDSSLYDDIYHWLVDQYDFDKQYAMIETLLFEKDYFDTAKLKELLFITYQQNKDCQDHFSQYRLQQLKGWLKKF